MDKNMESFTISGPGTFQFSGVDINTIDDATEFTLVTLVLDVSGSVESFADHLLNCLKMVIEACKKSPRSENLLFRVITFNRHISEIHGFKSLNEINPDDYDNFDPDGRTALYDAVYSGVGATLTFAEHLVNQMFDVNGCVYIITDGCDNESTMTPSSIKEKINDAEKGEEIESLLTVLVALKDPKIQNDSWLTVVAEELEKFQKEAEIDQFVNIGDATPGRLAKLANFISRSVSSSQNSLGHGTKTTSLTI